MRYPKPMPSALSLLLAVTLLSACHEATPVYSELALRKTQHRNLTLRMNGSVFTVPEAGSEGVDDSRSLSGPSDTTIGSWQPNVIFARIALGPYPEFQGLGFLIQSRRELQPGDTLRLSEYPHVYPDTSETSVEINDFSHAGVYPNVHPRSFSLSLEAIPFASDYQPKLPADARRVRRKAFRYRVEFDGNVLEGETYSIEYLHVDKSFNGDEGLM